MNLNKIYLQSFGRALKPEPLYTVSEWADRYRMLDSASSAESGKWRTSRTPYLKEIMDVLSTKNTLIKQVAFMKGAQVGASEMGNNWLGYIIHHAPAPILYVMPTTEMAKRASKQRIAPLIESTPEIKSKINSPRMKDSGNTMLMKEFEGGVLVMTGANSAVGLRSMPVRFLFLDEIDAYPLDISGEGSPIELAIKRTATFKRNRKIFMVSTPTVKDESHIERLFLQSDQRYYYVPCPHCGEYQIIKWKSIVWEDGKPDTAQMVCELCGGLIPEWHKTDMLDKGEWRSTAETENEELRGYHLSALYSPLGWYSWSDAVRDFLNAKNNKEAMKTWVNTTLGEVWEEDGYQADPDALISYAENYDSTTPLPTEILLLTAGVDTQDDRLECQIVGWAKGGIPYIVSHDIFWGDPSRSEVWHELDNHLLANHGGLKVVSAFVDSGGHHTEMVYRWTKVRNGRRIFACKGMGGSRDPVSKAKQVSSQRTMLILVGVDSLKRTILGWLKQPQEHIHFSKSLDFEWYQQLTAERMIMKKRKGFTHIEWVKTRERNEALDCLVYAYGALLSLNPKWETIKRKGASIEKSITDLVDDLPVKPRNKNKFNIKF